MSVRKEQFAENTFVYCGDNREILPTLGRFDACVTDPPYGIAVAKNGHVAGGSASAKWRSAKRVDYGAQSWDESTCDEGLFAALAMAEHSIVFGGNYYALPPSSCWLVWDKDTNGNLADCELAWTNLPKAVRRLRYLWNGFARANGEPRGDHPTQKPLGVMRWALAQLPADAKTICDPFMGSGTTGVVCVEAGLGFTGIEREVAYFDTACRRISDELRRPRLFAEPIAKPVQEALFG